MSSLSIGDDWMNELLAQAGTTDTQSALLTLGPDPVFCVTIYYSVATQIL
jgi:hypothetical protein